jgi:hypothetical protein
VTIVRVGATKKYSDGWESAFSKGRSKSSAAPAAKKATAASAKAAPAKKASAKKTAVKPSAKKKATGKKGKK